MFCFRQHLENWRPKLWEVGNMKFFHMIDIYEKAAILIFFIMAKLYSVSINTWKLETQTLGEGVSNLKFFCTININEVAAIFQFSNNS